MAECLEKKGLCGICPSACGLRIEKSGETIKRVRGWKGHPLGIPCARGLAAPDVVYSPCRLKEPLKRKGPKPSMEFEPISWDQAMEEIAAIILELKSRYGPQCIASFQGRGNFFEASMAYMFRPQARGGGAASSIFMPLGSPNGFSVGSLCFVSWGLLAPIATFGRGMRILHSDLENADVIFVWGANPATDSPPVDMVRLMEAKKRGAIIVAVDPVKSATAKVAHMWVPVRPGTDGALIHALAKIIIDSGKYDKDFVKKYTRGFATYKEYVRQFTVDVAAKITWVDPDFIEEMARLLVLTEKVALLSFTGLEYSNSGVQSIRALYTLWAITGHLDVEGGLRIAELRPPKLYRPPVNPPEDVKPIGYDRYPWFCEITQAGHFMEFPRSVLREDPYKIRFLMIGGASVLTGCPDVRLFERSLAALDYLVCVDRFPTADMLYADYVLPATTYFENLSFALYPLDSPSPSHIQLRKPVIPPVGKARSDYSIYAELAHRLGYGHLYPLKEEEMIRLVIKDLPLSYEELESSDGPVQIAPGPDYSRTRKWESGLLRRDGRPGFSTPSGKWEIASTVLKRMGYDPLPLYIEPTEGPEKEELRDKFPLIFTSGARINSTYRSQHLNIPKLLKLQPCAEVLIHPEDAEPRNIRNGDRVFVISPRGSVVFVAHVTDRIRPGVVEANMGGGNPSQAEGWREANVNLLTDAENRDQISGFPVFKGLLCDVKRVD